MAEINLLKNELQEKGPFSFGPPGLMSVYIVVSIIALEILLYSGLAFYQRYVENKARDVEKQAMDMDLEIKKMEASRLAAISFQRRVNNLQFLLNNHVFWTPVFDELEKYTYKGARYQTLQVDQSKRELLVSGTIPSYTELGKLMLGLKQSANVSNVTLNATGATQSGEAGYEFTMQISFDSKLLTK